MRTQPHAIRISAEFEKQMQDFFAQGGQVEKLGTTQLKKVPLILDPKKIQNFEKTKPVRI